MAVTSLHARKYAAIGQMSLSGAAAPFIAGADRATRATKETDWEIVASSFVRASRDLYEMAGLRRDYSSNWQVPLETRGEGA